MQFKRLLTVVFIFIILRFKTLNGYKNKSTEYLLYENIIVDQGYRSYLRPVVDSAQAVVVNMSLNLLNMIAFDEVAEQLTITAEVTMSWIDEYLTWDPMQYDGLKSINIPQDNVWRPDIGFDNSVSKHTGMGTSSMYVSVSYDGYVSWNPMEVFLSTCPADVTKYPMDTQICCLDFEAWNFAGNVVQIKKGHDQIQLDHGYDGLPQWSISKTEVKEKIENGFNYLTFCISIERQSLYVMLNIILPIALLSILNCCVFLLPAASGEKASFSVTVFLSLSVFLTIVSAQLPHTSNKVSIFNLYVFCQVLISTFVTITALLEIRLYHRSQAHPVPSWIRKLVITCRICKSLKKRRKEETKVIEMKSNENGVLTDTGEITGDHNEQFPELEKTQDNLTWENIVSCLDPVMFAFYTCLNIAITLGLVMWSTCV